MRWLRLIFPLPMVLLLGADGFRGCGGGPDLPPEGEPLPVEPAECTTDADCVPAACEVIECVLGECVVLAPMRDDDGDGHSPPPCGGDCDDSRADAFPDAEEICNALDDDCDGTVDDGAMSIDAVYPIPSAGPLSVVVPWGDELLVTTVTRSAIWGVPVSIGGTTGIPLEITRLTMGSRFSRLAAATQSDGRVLLVASTDLGSTAYLIFRRGADGMPERIAGPTGMDTPSLTALEVVPFGSEFAIGYEGLAPTGPVRAIVLDPDAVPVVILPIAGGAAPFGFATDGTHVVMTDDLGFARFYLPDGTEAAAFEVPNIGTVARPLASSDGTVIAGFADVFDYVLAPIDSVAGIGVAERAPEGPDLSFEVHTTSDSVLTARSGGEGTLVTPLALDLVTRTGGTLGLAPPGTVDVAVSVAETTTATGVLAGWMGGGQLAILDACE